MTNISILTPLNLYLPFSGNRRRCIGRLISGTLNSKTAEVNGTKPKSLRISPKMPHKRQKSRAKKWTLLDSQSLSMGVFSDDFAAVDFREELCYHSRPEKAKFKRCNERQKPMKESPARRKKRQPIPKRFSGDGSAPPRFLFGFPVISFSWRVLGCGERSEPHLSMPSTRHGAKSCFSSCYRPL